MNATTRMAEGGRDPLGVEARVCASCGRPARPSDVFCTDCGEALPHRRRGLSRRVRALAAGAALTAAITAAVLSTGVGERHPPTVNVHVSPTGQIVP
jgi:predicted amidophosphoribosyltransferase